jgi:hypothetical protein
MALLALPPHLQLQQFPLNQPETPALRHRTTKKRLFMPLATTSAVPSVANKQNTPDSGAVPTVAIARSTRIAVPHQA